MQQVLVTGATGVLGREAVPRLVAAGYRVRGLARSPGNAALLRSLGAEPVPADLFAPASLAAAVAGCGAVLHLATKIPPSSRAPRRSAWRENDHLRAEGTRLLVDAALAAGVGAFVYPSVVFVYPDGGARWLDAAATPPAEDPPANLRSTLVAEAAVARFAAVGGRGVVLRMGLFYGPSSEWTRDLLRLARWGVGAVFGAADGYDASVWVPDAGAAVVAALVRAPAGVYDVVDDEPLTRRELTAALAHAVGRRRLLRPPAALLRVVGGEAVASLAASRRVSNRRFREAAGWAPAVPSARAGWPLAASAAGAAGRRIAAAEGA